MVLADHFCCGTVFPPSRTRLFLQGTGSGAVQPLQRGPVCLRSSVSGLAITIQPRRPPHLRGHRPIVWFNHPHLIRSPTSPDWPSERKIHRPLIVGYFNWTVRYQNPRSFDRHHLTTPCLDCPYRLSPSTEELQGGHDMNRIEASADVNLLPPYLRLLALRVPSSRPWVRERFFQPL